MDGEIPDIDVRVRARLLRDMDTPALIQALQDFHHDTGIPEGADVPWLNAIMLVQDPDAFPPCSDDEEDRLTVDERKMLELDSEQRKQDPDPNRRLPTFERNRYSKWRYLPWQQWKIIILCAVGAATQGWAEACVNGAQQWYQAAFQKYIEVPSGLDGLHAAPGIVGLINGAPYLCCVVSCWLTPLLNEKFGRRGTIFWSTAFSIIFAALQVRAQSWWELFIYRLLLGVGIGPKSATIPIYMAECAPASIRGSLVMFWQVSTAFGVMLGSLSGVALQYLGNVSNPEVCPPTEPTKLLGWSCSKNWRLILASSSVLPIFLFLYIYSCHESPRWTVAEGHRLRINLRPEAAKHYYQKAYKGLEALSRHRLLAARDMLSHYYLLDEEWKDLASRLENHPRRAWLIHQFSELFGRRRNRRAIMASSMCMFAQQLCGVNLIVYYSNFVFAKINLPKQTYEPITSSIVEADPAQRLKIDQQALLYTMGFGLINFFFAAPAFFTIDTVGRRTLLLCTFPFLAVSHFITTAAFAANSTRAGPYVALTGMYLFGVFYSFGEGPVPFVYASESMPLYCREQAMAFVVSINWLFNWLIAFGAPWMFAAMEPVGTFVFFGVWCIIIWFMILFLVPETRLLKLEELDYVFDKVKTGEFGEHALKTLRWQLHIEKAPPERLYEDFETRVEREQQAASLAGGDVLQDGYIP